MNTIQQQIRELARQKNAVIMAHYYVPADVQEVADIVGDSLALAQQAAHSNADIIVLCGTDFMAETAAILCPDKKILIPAPEATCSLAQSMDAQALAHLKAQHPHHTVVSYVNTTAAVKALTDIVVTSSNALHIVQSLPPQTPIIFGPDRHLGRYIQEATHREMLIWDGCCHVHSRFCAPYIRTLMQRYPQARLLAHPECPDEVVAMAHCVGSTAALLHYVEGKVDKWTSGQTYIVATESGVIHQMQRAAPHSTFIPAAQGQDHVCEYMKMITLQRICDCLHSETQVVSLPAHIAQRALIPIQRMLQLS